MMPCAGRLQKIIDRERKEEEDTELAYIALAWSAKLIKERAVKPGGPQATKALVA